MVKKAIKKVLASVQTKRVQAREEKRKAIYNNNFKLFLQGTTTGF